MGTKVYLETVVKELVDYPERVRVSEVVGEASTILELHVAPEDVGKVIGKHGRMADTLRYIVGAVGAKLRKRFVLQIVEA